MSNVMRLLRADPQGVIQVPVDSSIVIEVGDLVYLNTDDVRPAGSFTYVSGNLAQTQANFRRDFLGVAMTASASGETVPVSVATRGTLEMPCAAATFEIGDMVAPDDNAGGDTLEDQQVIAVGENAYGGILRVSKRYGSNTTRVQCEIVDSCADRAPQVQELHLGSGLITAAAGFLTNMTVEFPFKLVAVKTIIRVALTGQSVLTVENGTTDLDDTHSITSGGAVGVVDRTAMDDASGNDLFEAGDTISVDSDGGASAGEAAVILEIIPFPVQKS